jgi:hypothetical protein
MSFPSRLRGGLRRAAIAAAATAGALLLAEAAARAWIAWRGAGWSAAALRERVSQTLAGIDAGRTGSAAGPALVGGGEPAAEPAGTSLGLALHPFLGYDLRAEGEPWGDKVERVRARERPEDYFVLLVGGSVAALFASPKEGALDRLGEILAADPALAGRRLQCLMLARGGYKQPQQLNVLTWLLAHGAAPDAVLNLDGFNDVALASANLEFGAYPLYPSTIHWSPLAREGASDPAAVDLQAAARAADARMRAEAARIQDSPWTASAIAGRLLEQRFDRAQAAWVAAQDAWVARAGSTADAVSLGPAFQGDLDAAMDAAVRCWRESSLAMHQLCEARGIFYLHVLQPTLHDPGAKRITREERERGTVIPAWTAGVERGYPRLRAGLQELADQGVRVLDASRIFADVGETLYVDGCHLNRRGHELLAEAVAAAWRSALAR